MVVQGAMGNLEQLCREYDSIVKDTMQRPGGVSECATKMLGLARQKHEAGMGGAFVCRAISAAADKIITALAESFLKRRSKFGSRAEGNFCIVALGGYGRGELAPKSDIDIMFLYGDSLGEEFKKQVADAVMYPLWNTHFALGHSSRTVPEALAAAKSDILARTAMMDARLIFGSKIIFSRFERGISAMCRRDWKSHIDGLMRLKRDRHEKCGWSPYLQEPNLKNGIGGLRDAQTLAWKIRLKYGGGDYSALVRKGMLSLPDYKLLRRAVDFIKRVRNQMHLTTNRASDLLDLELQPVIAQNVGFRDTENSEGVEDFMQKLYSSFRIVDTAARVLRKRMGIALTDDVLASMRQSVKVKYSKKRLYRDGFVIYNGVINAQRSDVFRKDPTRLIRLFCHIQNYRAVPSETLELLMRDSIGLIDDSLRSDEAANAAFLSIFKNRGSVAPVLEMMHFWGILGAFIPEFGEITCFVQHEFYHRYTADVHTLNTIAFADKIFKAREGEYPYWDYHTALMSVRFPAHLIYLILFLHDIGKSDGIKGHAQVGAEIGGPLLRRLGVLESDIEPVLFTVRNHLEMARFWQSHDIDDERAVDKFLSLIPSEEHLKFLYVATYCDAMGTSETFWNSYKQTLHSMLYAAALRKMRTGDRSSAKVLQQRKERLAAELLELEDLPEPSQFALERVDTFPLNYFAFHSAADMSMHVGMIGRLFRRARAANSGESVPPVIKWIEDPDHSVVRMYVVSDDSNGLFSLMAGVITMYGMKILSSKAFTCSDGVTIDTFYLTGIAGVSQNKSLRARFANEVVRYYSDRPMLDKMIDEIFYSPLLPSPIVKEIFVRREGGKIVLEFSAPDRAGLLYKISSAIARAGYSIAFARINTEGSWAFDSFQIAPLQEAASVSALSKTIKAVFAPRGGDGAENPKKN